MSFLASSFLLPHAPKSKVEANTATASKRIECFVFMMRLPCNLFEML